MNADGKKFTRMTTSIAEATMAAHDASMSDDLETAAAGRFMKELIPAWDRWLKAERSRGTDIKLLPMITAGVTVNLPFWTILTLSATTQNPLSSDSGRKMLRAFGQFMASAAIRHPKSMINQFSPAKEDAA